MKTDLEKLLDELIEYDPDLAERFIEKHLARIALKMRLQEYKIKKLRNAVYQADKWLVSYIAQMSSYNISDTARQFRHEVILPILIKQGE